MACSSVYLDVLCGFETVELIEEFQHGPLDFWVAAPTSWLDTWWTNRINLVHKDNWRGVLSTRKKFKKVSHKKASNKGITIWLIPLPSHNEQLSDHPRSFTDELLHQFRARDSDEGTFSVMGDCTGQQSLASSWKPKFLVKNTIYYCLPFHKKMDDHATT